MMCSASADYDGAAKLAYNTLLKYSNGMLPVNVKQIVKSFKNIKLISFKKYMRAMGYSYEELIDKFGSERGFTIFDSKEDKYLIVYNKEDDECTQRWTIAHELGHILMGHLKREDYNLIHYNNGEHPMEKEANTFAKHLLAPFPLISRIKVENKNYDIVSPDKISIIFDINITPSAYICQHFSKLYYCPRDMRLESKFSKSIESLKVDPFKDFQEVAELSPFDDFLF